MRGGLTNLTQYCASISAPDDETKLLTILAPRDDHLGIDNANLFALHLCHLSENAQDLSELVDSGVWGLTGVGTQSRRFVDTPSLE